MIDQIKDGGPTRLLYAEPTLDDGAVDAFAAAMKAKMTKSRAKGRRGWDDKSLFTENQLQTMLVEHLAKGDPIDVGNFAMMLFNRGEKTAHPAQLEGGPAGSGGWEKFALEMERQRDYWRQRVDTLNDYKDGNVWFWQGDGEDHLESMGKAMLVVIRADQLRELSAPPAQTQPPRLTESEIHGIHYIESECREQPSPMMFARAIESKVWKQLGIKDQEGGEA